MGQRHQIFIKIHNQNEISKKELKLDYVERWSEDLPRWRNAKMEYKKYKDALGTKKTTVLAFHNQWLYGGTALVNALQVLTFSKFAGKYHNPFHKTYFSNNMRSNHNVDWFIHFVENLMNIRNSEMAVELGRVGIDNSFLLNVDEPQMREYFDRGDNNDGCTIIDTTTHKYCFVSFDGTEGTKQLPNYVPISALDYIRSYYPEDPNGLGYEGLAKGWDEPKNLKPIKEREKISKERIESNKKLADKFKDFSLMTLDELKKMFPKVYAEISPDVIGKVKERG